ncbi:zinc ribbon domain-containing protein [Staphylococcus massiliensis]|uniref:FmdB family zinc ribbon protein n=1 Tax=Staphylococcus massiliensis TaxID=555791 RepID=UPI001EDE785B|nr:zinc ribbon domain-containing protein [Staphylococcus massiliensis]MCG3412173.1 zinc ribbon domain-containing protein [Staphylococcus massiliensis]
MPSYTYECANCGSFNLRQSIKDNHEVAKCPNCDEMAKRVYVPFQTYSMDQNLKKRIERGKTPRVVSGDKLMKNKPRRNNNAQRPWMTGH